jgi:DNA-binding transcriptional LysR family regulator
METRLLRYFLTVADSGSVTAAAAQLHVTQPVLSRQVRVLERKLGFTLFDRNDNRLRLSSAGREFLPSARDVVNRAELARKAAEAIAGGSISEVVISSPGTTLNDVIAPFLATWGPSYPSAKVQEQSAADIYTSLRAGVDLAVGTQLPPAPLVSKRIAVLPVWAQVPRTHGSSRSQSLELRRLVEQEHLLLLHRGHHAREAFERALDRVGVQPVSVTELVSPQVAQALAASGRGVAVVSDDSRFDLACLPLLAQESQVTITLHAAWDPHHHARRTLSHIADDLRQFCSDRYPPQDQ